MGGREDGPEAASSVLERVLRNAMAATGGEGAPAGRPSPEPPTDAGDPPPGRYDFDLAEFPLFSFCKPRLAARGRAPLAYADTITGRYGKPVARSWAAYPGPFGVGGASAQALLFDLLQLYWEQGATGSTIQFGTLRSLLLRRGGRNPSRRDYDRVRRDLDVLRGYDFHCTNAFWDTRRKAYVDMKWRLFGSVFFFKPHPDDPDRELPYGFVEVSPVFREAARSRGLFSLGFTAAVFHQLKPLEQRLAVYLAKKFASQAVHRRFVDDLARALPVEAADPADVRKAVKAAAGGLVARGVPILAGFRVEKGRAGRYLATFDRLAAPPRDHPGVRPAAATEPPEVAAQVDRIAAAVGSAADRLWWAQCVRRLGAGAVDRGLGLLAEARRGGRVRSPGALLTTFFKGFAAEQGVLLA
ncbi:MAG: hypothetical protein K2X87_11075 [Gemmataceae bacterium]|nr:hypothetical protein [Gemmataceae bacterium]